MELGKYSITKYIVNVHSANLYSFFMQFPTKIAIILLVVIYLSQILTHICVIIIFSLLSNCK